MDFFRAPFRVLMEADLPPAGEAEAHGFSNVDREIPRSHILSLVLSLYRGDFGAHFLFAGLLRPLPLARRQPAPLRRLKKLSELERASLTCQKILSFKGVSSDSASRGRSEVENGYGRSVSIATWPPSVRVRSEFLGRNRIDLP